MIGSDKKPTAPLNWSEKRKSGIASYLFWDGVLKTGGAFAVVMQIIGYFLLRDEGQSFGEYFASPRTWATFFLHATIFGLIIGYLTWRRNEAAFKGNIGS
jgi:uncharacterized membrane protein